MAEDIGAQQNAMAQATMQAANEQHQAHAYQQMLVRASQQAAPEQQQEVVAER